MQKVVTVFLMVGALGCGAEPPMNTDRPDAGTTPDVQAMPDTPPGDDRVAPPPDMAVGPDVPVPPVDASPSDAPPAMVCRPTLEPPETCSGQLCQPNAFNPTCAGASGCTCDMRAEDMPATLCTPERMPSCRKAQMSCSPGRNHCSINLPEGVDYAPVPFLDPDRDGRGGLRRTLGANWRRADLSTGGVPLNGSTLFSPRGFVQVCSNLPQDLDGIPSEMAGQPFCAECAGMTCYWNRGALRERLPSVEITLASSGCQIEVRYFLSNETTAARVRTYNSLSEIACN